LAQELQLLALTESPADVQPVARQPEKPQPGLGQ